MLLVSMTLRRFKCLKLLEGCPVWMILFHSVLKPLIVFKQLFIIIVTFLAPLFQDLVFEECRLHMIRSWRHGRLNKRQMRIIHTSRNILIQSRVDSGAIGLIRIKIVMVVTLLHLFIYHYLVACLGNILFNFQVLFPDIFGNTVNGVLKVFDESLVASIAEVVHVFIA